MYCWWETRFESIISWPTGGLGGGAHGRGKGGEEGRDGKKKGDETRVESEGAGA